jgi:GTPase SAR1 family protein
MSKKNVQPAIKSYFFGKGYRDLGHTIADSWFLNWEAAKKYGGKFTDYWGQGSWYYFMAAGSGFAAFSVVVFGGAFFLALSVIHIAILFTFFLLIYLSFTLIWGVDKLYRIRNKIFTACPVCHHKSELPIYLCSKCGAAHTNLIPNNYGILKRRCNCGEKLPTFFLNGRGKLNAKCHHCGHGIETLETTPVCIPIIGGPSVGKTCYLVAAAKELIETTAPEHSWETPFLNKQNEDIYNRALQDFNKGMVPAKTTELTPTAFNFFIKSKKWSADKILYFYDAAGEAFQTSSELLSHRFYGYLHGFLFIIDPFSIPELLNEYEDNLKIHGSEIRPSEMMLEDAFDTMLINLEKNHKIKRDEQVSKPCAIVINKIDAFDLEDRIGHKAVKDYLVRHPEITGFKDAEDQLCKELLKSWGLGNFLRKVEQKFKKYRFYTCSALGHLPDTSNAAFKPYRVIEPLLWLLGGSNRDLRVK